ncbi:hypothetical protein J1N35_004921 [Gossypium stocksii]|uniref:Reverse transcriptase zinc-binding domain-containing protein n=1 Tax=Gossypium stocksii TaxID=47602 RepID=A0A9D4AIS4_9ROSI|nr:hypothetical protein J1N35_004921 [Gossypium stocksii]
MVVHCWEDAWVPKLGPLILHVPSMDRPTTDCKLRDMVLEEGAWNLEAFREKLPEEIVKRIVNIPPSHPLARFDKIFWVRTSSGGFLIKSAYQMIKENTWNTRDTRWKNIWKFQGSHHVRFFLWLVCKQWLFTNLKRV